MQAKIQHGAQFSAAAKDASAGPGQRGGVRRKPPRPPLCVGPRADRPRLAIALGRRHVRIMKLINSCFGPRSLTSLLTASARSVLHTIRHVLKDLGYEYGWPHLHPLRARGLIHEPHTLPALQHDARRDAPHLVVGPKKQQLGPHLVSGDAGADVDHQGVLPFSQLRGRAKLLLLKRAEKKRPGAVQDNLGIAVAHDKLLVGAQGFD